MPTLRFLDAVSKTAVISLESINLTQQWHQDVKSGTASKPHQISSWSVEKCARKWRQQQNCVPAGFEHRIFHSRGGALTTRPTRRSAVGSAHSGCLDGPVVRGLSAFSAGGLGIALCCPCCSHTTDFNRGALVATLPGVPCNRVYRLVGLVVKASALRVEDSGFESRLRRDFWGVESYQWLKNWHSSGYPARRLAL